MGKKPKHPSAVAQLKAWARRRLRPILWIAGAITTLAVCVTAVSKASDTIEPYGYVSSGTFRAEIAKRDKHIKTVEDRTDKRFLDIQIDQARQAQRTTKSEVYRWQDKVDDEKEPDKRAVYRDRLHEYQGTLDALEKQIETLNRQR